MIRFCGGVLFIALIPKEWVWPAWPVLVGLSLLLMVPRYRLLLAVLLGAFLGLGSASWGIAHKLPVDQEGQNLQLTGEIIGLPQKIDQYCHYLIAVDSLSAQQQATPWYKPIPRKLSLADYHCEQLLPPGVHGVWQVRLKRPHGYANQGGMDAERRWFSQGIDARGYIRQTLLLDNNKPWSIDYLRWRITQQINQALINRDAKPLLQALLIGDKRALTAEHWQVFRETGTIHLLVISGLHIGLVSGFAWLLSLGVLRLIPQSSIFHRRLIAAGCALAAALSYALLAGFTLPTQRALVMTSLVLYSWLGRGQYHFIQRLALAVMLVLLLDPLAMFSPGFWLSFAAAAMLLYLIKAQGAVKEGVRCFIHLQAGLALLSIPLLALFFNQVPVSSVLVNFLAVPLVSFILLPLSLLAMLLFLSPWQSVGLLRLVADGWGLFWQGLQWLHDAVAWTWQLAQPSLFAVSLAILGTVWLMAPRMVPGRLLGCLFWLPLLLPKPALFTAGEYEISVLDVGQGLAVHVRTANHQLIYDTGASYSSGFSVAEKTLIPYLRAAGIERINRLLVSHGDNDHAGGYRRVLQQLSVDESLVNADGVVGCQRGQNWQWDGVDFQVLHPDGQKWVKSNNRSCVLKITSDAGSVLIPGDIEAEIERRLLSQEPQSLKADVLVVPHHGSQTSSTLDFILAVQPRFAAVSAGYRSRFGHPHPAVISRYTHAQITVLNTAEKGQLSFHFQPGSTIEVTEYRKKNNRYWTD